MEKNKMKNILLTMVLSAILMPISATANQQEQKDFDLKDSEHASNDVESQSQEQNKKMLSDEQNMNNYQEMERNGSDRRSRPDVKNMNDAEKSEFFNKKIKRMKKHLDKMPDGKNKNRKEMDVDRLEKMSLSEQERWFKSNKKKMKKKHKNLKNLCRKIENDDFSFNMASSMSNLQESSYFKEASGQEQQKMIKRLEKFSSFSAEEKEKRIKRKKEKLSNMCKSINNKQI